jgi:hypothetical protein
MAMKISLSTNLLNLLRNQRAVRGASYKVHISVKHNNPSIFQNTFEATFIVHFGAPKFTINVDTSDLFFRRPDGGSVEPKHVALNVF